MPHLPNTIDAVARVAAMSDTEFEAALRACELPPGTFNHESHVRLAWILLRRLGLWEAVEVYREDLKRFATHAGAPEKYHETVTVAYMVLVNERVEAEPDVDAWAEFKARQADLLRWLDGPLFERYDPSILRSPTARRTFVLPGS